MSEQVALQQRGGNRRAVNCYELLLSARTGIMNSPGDYFLARTRLASDQHTAIRWCYYCHVLKNSHEAGAGPDQVGKGHDLLIACCHFGKCRIMAQAVAIRHFPKWQRSEEHTSELQSPC